MKMLKSFLKQLGASPLRRWDDPPGKGGKVRKIPTLLESSKGKSKGPLVTPREFSEWAHEQYLSGVFSREEYSFAMPAEMHPDYNRTIGALTGEIVDPDEPRDMLGEWEERLAFLRRHNALNDTHSRYAAHILKMLRRSLAPGGSLSR